MAEVAVKEIKESIQDPAVVHKKSILEERKRLLSGEEFTPKHHHLPTVGPLPSTMKIMGEAQQKLVRQVEEARRQKAIERHRQAIRSHAHTTTSGSRPQGK